MNKIELSRDANKQLNGIKNSNPKAGMKIQVFLDMILAKSDNPCKLPNALKIQGFSDNRYRWRIGDYRIIGIVIDGEYKIIEIIKISTRGDAYNK